MSNFELIAPNAFVRQATYVDDPALVEMRLQELHPDLTISLMSDAIRRGLEARNDFTRASATIAPGLQQWLKTVEDLRTLLATLQWHIHDQNNCPFISSPDRAVSIVIMTGDCQTGKIGFEDPTNQAEKGIVAEKFTHCNRQLALFNNASLKLSQTKQEETQVWVLLYHYDKALKEVRFELSLPTGFSKKKITEWGARLILGSIPNNPADFAIYKDAPNTPATVEVKPKTGTF